jgi:hypothetical protein
VGVGAFTLLGTWFTALGLRRDRATRTTRHLTISSAAMVLMYVMHGRSETHHRRGRRRARCTHRGGRRCHQLVALLLTLVLAGYFAWHTWTCVERSRSAKGADTHTDGPRSAVRAPARVEHVAHGNDERPHGGDAPGRDLTGRTDSRAHCVLQGNCRKRIARKLLPVRSRGPSIVLPS